MHLFSVQMLSILMALVWKPKVYTFGKATVTKFQSGNTETIMGGILYMDIN